MHWNSRLPKFCAVAIAGSLVVALLAVHSVSAYFAGAGKLTVFWRGGSYQVEIEKIGNKQYVDLASLLQPMGQTAASVEGGKYKIKFESGRAEFQNGDTQGRIEKNNVKLSEAFIVQENRGLVALRLVPDLLPYFVNEPVEYHAVSERMFVGASERHFTVEVKKSPAAVVLTFDQPVNPQVHTEPGKLILNFLRDGVSAVQQSWKFSDSTIASANYEETANGPEITVNASQPLMASFSEGGRVITVAPAPAAAANNTPTAAPASTSAVVTSTSAGTAAAPIPESQANAPASTAAGGAPSIPRSRFLVVIDAAHGGDERGAALSDKLAEKDVCLALARRLHADLQDRGVPTFMLRDSDASISLDERATAVNTAHPAIYIAVHVGTLGRGLRIYTSMLSPASGAASAFVPWETAQAGYLEQSRRVAGNIVQALGKAALDFPVAMMPAPVRPLNNITGAALAVELSPMSRDAESVNNSAYQEKVAAALATAIAAARPAEAAR